MADRVVTASAEDANAILVEDGRVAAMGSSDALRRHDVPEVSFEGKYIIPGLRDAHFHPLVYAAVLNRLILKDAKDLAEVADRVREWSANLPPGEPLIGSRLDDESLAEGRLPTRHDIDRAEASRPVLLHRYDGHLAVANTAALEAAGIGPDTPDPPGGLFDRDDTGAPTGVLRETAVSEVGRVVGSRSSGISPAQLLSALAGLPKLGLTSIGAMVSYELDPWCGAPAELETLVEVAEDLPLDVGVFVIALDESHVLEAAKLVSAAGGRLRFLGLKGFADGGLGGHTAALREPYSDAPQELGTMRLDVSRMTELARTSLALGGMVALHAIGDLANERVLDVFEALIAEGADPSDLRVEHASVLTPSDIERFADLGVIASIQPSFLPSETTWLEKRVGPHRLEQTYPFASMLEAGIPLAGGSDCPVEMPSPFNGLAASRDRAGIVPEQGLKPDEALGLFTDGAAHALREPNPLSIGSPANFLVTDVDPISSSPDQVRESQVDSVWLNGVPAELPAKAPDWPG